MHIPATGGSGVRSFLKRTFEHSKGKIHNSYSDPRIETASHERFDPEVRLVLGYYDYMVFRRLSIPPISICFLREPIDRVLSLYYLAKFKKDHFLYDEINSCQTSLEEFIVDPKYDFLVSNTQCKVLAAPADNKNVSEEVLLQMAKINLEEIAFFGLTDQFVDSLRLLADTFSFKYPEHLDWFKSKFCWDELDNIPDRFHSKLISVVGNDAQNYEYLKYAHVMLKSEYFDEILNYPSLVRKQIIDTFRAGENPVADIMKVNDSRPRQKEVSSSLLESITTRNRLDLQLHDYARCGFEQRLKWMENEKLYDEYHCSTTILHHDKNY